MSEHRLSEIVIERPRGGMRCSSRRLKGVRKELDKLTREATEDGLLSPYLIKVRNPSKHLSDHLGPLRRLLYSKIGQPWDEVYSELCQNLKTNTMAGQHVLSHVWGYVERYVEMIDGLPYSKYLYDRPYYNGHADHAHRHLLGQYRQTLYVHPETSVLCLTEKVPKTPPKQRDDLVVIDAYHHYRKLDEIWYHVTLQDLRSWLDVRDAVLNVEITFVMAQKEYGRQVYAISKRQCNKRELKFIRAKLAKL